SGDNFTFSPDSKFLVYTAVPAKTPAWSTNHDLCRVPITGGTENWECLTPDNPPADASPQFSPDGRKLAYRAQRRPGFEADKWEILVVDCERNGAFTDRPRCIIAEFDGSCGEFVWGPGGMYVYFTAEQKATTPVFRAPIM